MQTHLDITETDGSFDETETAGQVNLSWLIPFCPLPEIKIYDSSDVSMGSQTDTKVYPYKPR